MAKQGASNQLFYRDVSCTPGGNCKRNDGISLSPGIQPINKIFYNGNNDDDSKYTAQTIFSFNPFENAGSLTFIKGSEKYVCADGFKECIFSCCNKGFCDQATNYCSQFYTTRDRMIYLPCIFFVILFLVYWLMFILLGLKYSKKKMSITSTQDKNNDNNFNSNEYRTKNNSRLDNFDMDLPSNQNQAKKELTDVKETEKPQKDAFDPKSTSRLINNNIQNKSNFEKPEVNVILQEIKINEEKNILDQMTFNNLSKKITQTKIKDINEE